MAWVKSTSRPSEFEMQRQIRNSGCAILDSGDAACSYDQPWHTGFVLLPRANLQGKPRLARLRAEKRKIEKKKKRIADTRPESLRASGTVRGAVPTAERRVGGAVGSRHATASSGLQQLIVHQFLPPRHVLQTAICRWIHANCGYRTSWGGPAPGYDSSRTSLEQGQEEGKKKKKNHTYRV